MKKAIGIISSNHREEFLQGIVKDRPIAAVPFAGRYRLLDFALSSMVNSGLRTVGIITPFRYRPVLDHLGAGKEWGLDRKCGGLFVLPGSNHRLQSQNNKFSLKDFLSNIEFLEFDTSDYVILTGCSNVFNIDFRSVLESHEQNNADITMVYKELPKEDREIEGTFLNKDTDDKISSLIGKCPDRDEQRNLFADIFIINRNLFLEILKGYENIEYLGLMDVVEENIKTLKVYAYKFEEYLGRIFSVHSYYKCSMEMLNPEVHSQLFMGTNRIHTKIKDNPPTKYASKAAVRDSLVSSGCFIQGEVNSSILFRGVNIHPRAKIKNSIIMQRCDIGKDAVLENVILDKYVKVNEKVVLKGMDGSPMLIAKKAVV